MRPLPIGVDDFRKLREQGMEYVDKTHLIRDVLDRGAEVLLLPRPRRFGKTLNLSMLRWFFDKRAEDLSSLFADLSIWDAGDAYRAHFRRYPVIFLTFKSVKHDSYEACWKAIKATIEILFDEHRGVLDTGRLSEREAAEYQEVLERRADENVYARALGDLSRYLHRCHGEKVVIFIDEYDAPIHAGYTNGYGPQMLAFFRAFLTEGLKGNPDLFKAVLTGILRIAKESIFSGLNNFAVYTLLHPHFSTCFGFTEDEVTGLLDRAGQRGLLDDVRSYYNGYVFGSTPIYNPWSILNFIHGDGRLRPYWATTSSNDLVHDVLRRHSFDIQPDIELLLEGSAIEKTMDEDVVLPDLAIRIDAVWSLLVLSGYLRAEETPGTSLEIRPYRLSIPNREVRQIYTSTFRSWMSEQLGSERDVERLTQALLSGQAETVEEELSRFIESVLSYHDLARRPEQVYHAFVLGLLATLEPDHEVRSNRESGKGRPDVIIRPRRAGRPGAVLELKVARPEKITLEQALSEGLEQIRGRNYDAELRAAGASPVHAFVVAFDGKVVRVRASLPPP